MKNLSIKTKLILSIILPIIGMTYFASINIYERYKNASESVKIDQITKLNIKISDVIHELQKERGISSGFVSSKGDKFAKDIIMQQSMTDAKVKYLNSYIKYFNIQNNEFNIFKQSLNQEIKDLLSTRVKINSLKLSADDIIKKYSNLNEFLLDFIYSTSKYTQNIDISNAISSYSNFLFLKEITGIERALVTKIVTNNTNNINHIKDKYKLSNLIKLQENYLKQFFKFNKNKKIKKLRQSIHTKKLFNEIQRMENIILMSKNKYDIKPSYWFKTITQKIDNQNIMAKELSNQLILLSNTQKTKAYNSMIYYNIIAATILLIAIFLLLIITRNINFSVNKIIAGITNISQNKLSKFKKIDINSEDEFGTIAETLNSMTERLILKEKQNIKKTKEIKEAQKKAILSSKAKSEFLANMSHEIRTPLNAILGFIDLLKEETRGRKSATYVDIIDSSSKGLLKIIEDILDFSKIESGKLEIEKVDFNTKSEFEVITHLFDAKCIQKNISLNINIDESLPQIINTDPLRVKQVISNLLSNAVKFTHEGKNITVDINFKDNILNVLVKDEGIGIPKDKLDHIFEAFKQEDGSTTRRYGGTGLGLSISKELVNLLGGDLNVKSEVGTGSEFYFSIPVIIGEEINIKLSNNKDIDFKNKKILLAEDNKANQLFMNVILKKMNLQFDIANDGIEAVDMFKTGKYDAVLMDENMPNMNGIEATKQILAYEKQNNLIHTPIIALTANALKGDRERFLESGMDEYLTKPLDKKKLNNMLCDFLDIENKESIQNDDLDQDKNNLQIYGVDFYSLANNLSSKEEAKSLLKIFHSNYKEIKAIIEQLEINSDDFKNLIHKIKGISGNITANKLHDLCLKIEKEDNKRAKETVNKIINEISSIIQSIETNIIFNEKTDIVVMDNQNILQDIEKLIDDLNNRRYIKDKRAESLINSLRTKIKTDLIDSTLNSFSKYDYKNTVGNLKKIKEILNG